MSWGTRLPLFEGMSILGMDRKDSQQLSSIEKNAQHISPFCGAKLIPCFGLLVMSALGFKGRSDPYTCMLPHLCAMD